ncbi:hypothetical protein B5K06_24845 [Rhizobium grahamii]|uniref:Uncharacterized protein n=2 Tax=Rhizobium grahamii TaxID=1120045 RepID=A0A370KIG6_9HYPH|nr:hypothetical protein B5K06_24845 [Rhizobium grahamii]
MLHNKIVSESTRQVDTTHILAVKPMPLAGAGIWQRTGWKPSHAQFRLKDTKGIRIAGCHSLDVKPFDGLHDLQTDLDTAVGDNMERANHVGGLKECLAKIIPTSLWRERAM